MLYAVDLRFLAFSAPAHARLKATAVEQVMQVRDYFSR